MLTSDRQAESTKMLRVYHGTVKMQTMLLGVPESKLISTRRSKFALMVVCTMKDNLFVKRKEEPIFTRCLPVYESTVLMYNTSLRMQTNVPAKFTRRPKVGVQFYLFFFLWLNLKRSCTPARTVILNPVEDAHSMNRNPFGICCN